MKLFPCPSPRNTNFAGLFLNEAGRLVDRHGNDWGRSPRRMAVDALPSGLSRTDTGEKDHERRMQEMRSELETLIHDDLDLDDAVCAEIVRLLDKHVPWRRTRQAGPDATRGKGASDAHRKRARDEEDDEFDLGRFKAFLKGKGLSAEHIQEALRIVDRDAEEAEDELPTSGHLHGHIAGRSRASGERAFQPESRLLDDPNIARIGIETHHPERDRGLMPQVRDRAGRRRQAADAARAVTNEQRTLARFPEMGRILTHLGR